MDYKFNLLISTLLASHLLVVAYSARITSEGQLWGPNPVGSSRSVPKPNDPNRPNALVSAGVVDEKEYFAEINQYMGGKEAAEYCKSNGLKQATIESQNEVDLLNVTLREFNAADGGFKMYWTAGTESEILLEWEESRAPVNISLGTTWFFTNDHHYCLRFYPYYLGTTEFWTVRCDEEGFGFPLCQD